MINTVKKNNRLRTNNLTATIKNYADVLFLFIFI